MMQHLGLQNHRISFVLKFHFQAKSAPIFGFLQDILKIHCLLLHAILTVCLENYKDSYIKSIQKINCNLLLEKKRINIAFSNIGLKSVQYENDLHFILCKLYFIYFNQYNITEQM